jgi:hypothetical protein
MKTKLPACFILISAVLSPGCTSTAPSATVSESVIESILPTKRPETPWRLDSAWQGGGLGGSAFRGSSIEHVVRQADNKLSNAKSTSASGSTVLRPKPVPARTALKPGCKSNSVLK